MRQTTGKRKSPGEKIVKDIKRATRKHYPSEEKIRIVLDGLCGEDSIAELCRPLPGRVMQSMILRGVREFPKASIINGPSTARQCMFSCTRELCSKVGEGVIRRFCFRA
jgi:transposase-like protein